MSARIEAIAKLLSLTLNGTEDDWGIYESLARKIAALVEVTP